MKIQNSQDEESDNNWNKAHINSLCWFSYVYDSHAALFYITPGVSTENSSESVSFIFVSDEFIVF